MSRRRRAKIVASDEGRKRPRKVYVMDESAAIAWADRVGDEVPDVIQVRTTSPYKLCRNGLERAYAEHLEQLRIAGEIADWRYEDLTFRIGHDCRCVWDFLIVHNDGRVEMQDTKGGHVEPQALVKARTFRRIYPWMPLSFVTRRKDGGWVVTPFK